MLRSHFPRTLVATVWICIFGSTAQAADKDFDIAALEGKWQLDRQASDDVRARLLPLFELRDRRWKRDVDRFDELAPPPTGEGRSGPQGDDGISHLHWMERERQKEAQALIAMLSPATQLEIRAAGRSIRIANDKGEGSRVITPGEESALFLSLGSFEVSSEWKKGTLLIESRGTGDNSLRITERYTVHAGLLEERIEVKIPGIRKQSFKAVYRR